MRAREHRCRNIAANLVRSTASLHRGRGHRPTNEIMRKSCAKGRRTERTPPELRRAGCPAVHSAEIGGRSSSTLVRRPAPPQCQHGMKHLCCGRPPGGGGGGCRAPPLPAGTSLGASLRGGLGDTEVSPAALGVQTGQQPVQIRVAWLSAFAAAQYLEGTMALGRLQGARDAHLWARPAHWRGAEGTQSAKARHAFPGPPEKLETAKSHTHTHTQKRQRHKRPQALEGLETHPRGASYTLALLIPCVRIAEVSRTDSRRCCLHVSRPARQGLPNSVSNVALVY